MTEHTVVGTSPLGSAAYSLDAAVQRISGITNIEPDAVRDSLLGGDILEVEGVEYAIARSTIEQDTADLARDLLDLHKRTGISLDNWDAARRFVEHHTGQRVEPNGA